MHALASIPTDYCAGLFRFLTHNGVNNITFYTKVKGKKDFFRG
jgi:hypothetical protein